MNEDMSNEEILALDNQLHHYYSHWDESFGYSKEELLRWHKIVMGEMNKRGLPHKISDELTLRSSDQKPTWANYKFPEEILIRQHVIALIGDTVETFEKPTTTDFLLSAGKEFASDIEQLFTTTFASLPTPDFIIDNYEMVRRPNVPIYNLVLKRVDTLEIIYPEKECWAKAPWIASAGEKEIELEATTDLTSTDGLHKVAEQLGIGNWDIVHGSIQYGIERFTDHLIIQYPDGSYKQVLLEEDIYLCQPTKTQQYVLERYDDYIILRLSSGYGRVSPHDEISWTIQSEDPFEKAFSLTTIGAHSTTSEDTSSGKVLFGKQLPNLHEYYLSGYGKILIGKDNGNWRLTKPKDQIPWYYQQLQKGDFSQIGSRDEFIAEKITKTFKIAPPSGQLPSQRTLLGAKSNIKFIKKGEVLLIEGIALAQGIWQGIDLKTIYYSYGVLADAAPSLLQVQLKLHHKGRDVDVKGFVSRVWTDEANKCIRVRLMIFDQATILLLLSEADEFGLSVEGYAIKLDRSKKPFVAHQIAFTMIVLTDDPACKVCKIDPSTMEVITLE